MTTSTIVCEDRRGNVYYYTRATGRHCITRSIEQAHKFASRTEAIYEIRRLGSDFFTGLAVRVFSAPEERRNGKA